METLEIQFTLLAHFEESLFEEDVSHCIVGQDPQKRRRSRGLKHQAVQTIFSQRPQSSKPRKFSVECAAKSEWKKVSKYQVFGI